MHPQSITPRRRNRPCIPVAERFWKHVQKTDTCWLWTGLVNDSGYGRIHYERRPDRAHRISWILHYGPIPDGLWVLHNCPGGDNPSCVNPAHLWLGTVTDNNQDMWAKGRGWSPFQHRTKRP